MAISKVQGPVIGQAAANTITKSFVSTPTQGNLLIALGRGDTVIANASITGWTLATSTLIVGTKTLGLWYKVAGAGESKDVKLDWTSGADLRLAIEEWTGLSTTPLDQIANTNDTGSGVHSRSSGTTPTTTVANELCLAGISQGNTVTSLTWSNSYTLEGSKDDRFFLASLIVSATGAQETTATWTTDRNAGGLIATFKAPIVSAWTPKIIMI